MLWLIVVALTGCQPCPGEQLASGNAEANVNGSDWAAIQVVWVAAGSAVQVTTPSSDGWEFQIVSQRTADGATIEEAMGADAWPIEVSLDGGESGGWALAYPDAGASYSSANGGGSLTLDGTDSDELFGCFEFTAATEDGEEISVDHGAFRARPSDL